MDDIEEGEIPSSPEETYTPLVRPGVGPRPQSSHASITPLEVDRPYYDEGSDQDDSDIDGPAQRLSRGLPASSSSDSDSDPDTVGQPKRKMKRPPPLLPGGKKQDAGQEFRLMAARFQEDRARQRDTKKRNNVWGSILQEETLTSEMTGVVVGRSVRDLDTDRGAEAYDYLLAAEAKDKAAAEAECGIKSGLDSDLDTYWNSSSSRTSAADADLQEMEDGRRGQAIRAGKKRSVKDRLGSRKPKEEAGKRSPDAESWENMSIPQPGVSRNISDLNPAVLEECEAEMDDEGHLASILGDELAAKLCEPKTELMVGVVDMVGPAVAMELFAKTQEIEKNGGMMIKNGARRRTPGGVYLHLLREMGADESEKRVEGQMIRRFFAQSNRDFAQENKKNSRRNNQGDFKSELEAFKKLSTDKGDAASDMEVVVQQPKPAEEELKPLPDILSNISQRMRSASQIVDQSDLTMSTTSSSKTATGDDSSNDAPILERKPEAFVEPEAPPNSVERVERTISSYDDDDNFLSLDNETEDIELF